MVKRISFSAILRLMRPKQWIKNAFVLAPLIFSGVVFNSPLGDTTSLTHLFAHPLINSVIAFVLFCLASSAAYTLNDYLDIESDRKHPTKSITRPLASGDATKAQAIALLIFLYICIGLAAMYVMHIVIVILGYLVLNIGYSFYLKHQPVLDIFTIAIGFVLRVYAGAVALGVPLSHWMFITTLSLALYLAAIKRRQELANRGPEARNVLKHYSIHLVDKYAEISATSAILFYSLFVLSDRPEMVLTIPFVLFGVFRYWYTVYSKDSGESPTDALFSDIPLQLTILGWILACIYSLA